MKSDLEWLAWGKIDPLYAVATLDGKSKSGEHPWEVEAFFRLGAEDWRRFLPHWESYGVNRRRCLEIGCGVGRMTRAMATDFDELYAVDISPEMIANAQRHVARSSVQFVVSDGSTLPLEGAAVDAVFSTHVFQHLDSLSDGEACFREAYRVLAPGGTAMIHVPVILWPKGSFRQFHERLHVLQKRLGDTRAAVNRLLIRWGIRKRPIMRLTSYELRWLWRTLTEIGFIDIEMRMIFGGPMAAHQACHAFVLCRKPAAPLTNSRWRLRTDHCYEA
jgi:ubiquinone/menaquinone biosynthesis C-methylase UbiE